MDWNRGRMVEKFTGEEGVEIAMRGRLRATMTTLYETRDHSIRDRDAGLLWIAQHGVHTGSSL